MVDYLERALGRTEPDGEGPETGVGSGPVRRPPRRDRPARRPEPDWTAGAASGRAEEPDGALERTEPGDGGGAAQAESGDDAAARPESGNGAAEPGSGPEEALEKARRGAALSAAARGAGPPWPADGEPGQRQGSGPAEAAEGRSGRTVGIRSAAAYGGAGRTEGQEDGGDGPDRETADRPVDVLRMAGAEAGDLYARLIRSRSAAGYVRRETVAVTVPEPIGRGQGGSPPDARALDRQFQRDARRYDGGFALL